MFMDFRLWTLCLNKLSEIDRIRKLVFTFLSLIIFIRKIRFLFSLRQTFHRFYHFQFICQIECKVRGSISGFLFYCCQDKSKHLTLETLFFSLWLLFLLLFHLSQVKNASQPFFLVFLKEI